MDKTEQIIHKGMKILCVMLISDTEIRGQPQMF